MRKRSREAGVEGRKGMGVILGWGRLEDQCLPRAGSMARWREAASAAGPLLSLSSSSAPAQYQAVREVSADEPG